MLALWVAEDQGCHPETITAHFPNKEASREWLSVWSQIRNNPALYNLHIQFAPKGLRQRKVK